MVSGTLSAAAIRRQKRQRQKQNKSAQDDKEGNDDTSHAPSKAIPEGVVVEYVMGPMPFGEGEMSKDFAKVIERFSVEDEEGDQEMADAQEQHDQHGEANESYSENEDEAKQVSKKQAKKLYRMSVAQLKQAARHPEVVEWEDVTAKDPVLLVQLKAVRNSVPVPRHWSRKRKYLAGKRGYVKAPFELPQFIRDTGITELRDAARAEDATKRQKVKAREKMHPKLGKVSVDYERLYNAFFRYQTKPMLTGHGDLYYEGREFEGQARNCRPGVLGEELRAALGMTSHLYPPPWLHAIQKYGAPPSYPHMRIPGYNAPIPEGAQWGFHPSGWGKPPMDVGDAQGSGFAFGRMSADEAKLWLEPVERNLWGELEPDEEEEAVEEEQAYEYNPSEETVMASGMDDVSLHDEPDPTPSYYYQQQPVDLEGPETIELRKQPSRRV
jgi:splicing factor 3B subunit 2